jgi:hypothetical protein
MKAFMSFIAAIVCIAATAFTQENYSQWTGVTNYVLNTTGSGANVTGDVTNFPVLVRLGASDSAIFAASKTDGTDIRFTKANGERLQHQIEHWNSGARTAAIWVLVDTVKGNNATQMMKLRWGKADAADSSRATAVFDTAKGFQAVWHFSEGTSDTAFDATANNFKAVPQRTNASNYTFPEDTVGMIGRARRYGTGPNPSATSATAGNYFNVPGTATGRLNFPEDGAYSVSSWVRVNAVGTSRGMVSKGDRQYLLELRTTGSTWEFSEYQANAGWDLTDAATTSTLANTWQHLVGVRNGTTQVLYVDGAVADSTITLDAATVGARIDTFNLAIGRNASAVSRLFRGKLDEIRIASVARSANWVKLEYENQKAAQSLLTSLNPPSGLSYLADPANYVVNVPVTPNTATVTGVVDSFTVSPALPAGLTLNKTSGTISGTPTATTASANYAITAVNAAGSVTDSVNITVAAALPAAPTISYTPTSATYNVGTPISAITPTLGGGTVDSITVAPNLPAGLSLNKTSGVISGTPTAVSAGASYVFTATNLGGSAKDTINFTVLPAAPSNLVYPVQTVTYVVGEAIVNNVPTVSGSVDSFTVVPALPAGLSFSKTNGAISGLPTATSAATNYIVTAQNAGGSAKDTVNITVAAGEVFSDWSGHRTIWLNTNTNGANVTGTVTNFPVLVRLTTTDSVFAQSKGRGADIRFTKVGDVIRLKHQVESWDSVGKSAAIWVLLDSVKGANSTQTFRMHWNKTGASSLSNGAAVFDTARGYQAVWHFGEGNADTAFDATANAFRGAPQRSSGAVSFPSDTAGMVGRARYYGIGGGTVNSTGGYFSVPNSATGPLNFPENGTYTVSTWVNADTVGISRTLLSKSDKAYSLELRNTGADWEFAEFSAGTGWNVVNQAAAPQKTWVHLVGVRNGPASLLYVDGVLIDAETRLDASTAARRVVDFEIGRSPDGGTSNAARYYWRGMLDEVRLSSIARTADWAKLEFENQKTAQTLVWFTAPPVSIGSAYSTQRKNAAMLSVKSIEGSVRIQLPELVAGAAAVSLSDMRGRAVWNGTFVPGADLVWNGTDRSGQAAPAGLYLVRVKVTDISGTQRTLEARVPFTR